MVDSFRILALVFVELALGIEVVLASLTTFSPPLAQLLSSNYWVLGARISTLHVKLFSSHHQLLRLDCY